MFDNDGKTKNLIQAVPGVVMILVILVLVFTLILYNNDIQSSKHNFMEIGSNWTGQSARAMEVWLEDQLRITGMIADHPVMIEACLNPQDTEMRLEAEMILRNINERYPYYEALPLALISEEPIRILTSEGYTDVETGEFFIDSVGGNLAGKGGMELSYVRAIAEGEPFYVSEIYPSINSGEPIIAISKPIVSDGRVVGVAVVAPKLEYFTSRFVESATYGETGYMIVIDGRGMVVSHPERGFTMRDYESQGISEQRIINRVLVGQTFFEDNYLHMNKSYYTKRVSIDRDHQPYDWHLVFTMENSEIYENAEQLLQISISMLFGGTLLIAFILYLYTRSVEEKNREIQQLELNRKLEVEVAARTSLLAEKAIRDGLTKLYNHEAVYNALGVAVRIAKSTLTPLSVIMLDLDYFKVLNDTYGHPFGDQVLKETAKVIQTVVRGSDIVGRYGGEEFIVILPGASKQSAVDTAKRIVEGLKVLNLDELVNVTASMGVAAWLGEDVDELIARADKLLYQAKNKGRDRIESVFDEVHK